MNKRFIEELIPKAIELIDKNDKMKVDGGIPNEFNAYISSLGTSLSQAGLRQSIIFYSMPKENKEQNIKGHGANHNREEIIKVAEKLLQQKGIIPENINILEYVNSKSLEELVNFKPKLIDTIIAIKMAIRSFKMIKSSER